MSRRRILLAGGVLAMVSILPIVGYLLHGEVGLLMSLAVMQVLALLLVVRVWLSLDGSVRDLDRKLRRKVASMNKQLSLDLAKAEEVAEHIEAEREAVDSRLLEHERRAWELNRETLRQIGVHFQTHKEEVKNRGERADRALDRKMRAEYAQLEALAGMYYDLRPPIAFPATRSWVASPDLLRHLYERVRDQRPQLVLECGSGLSTVLMAYGLRNGGGEGRIIALEHLEKYADTTRRMLDDHGLTDYAEVRLAPLIDVELDGESWPWYDRSQLPTQPIDLLFVDGPPGATHAQARYPALPLLRAHLATGAQILLDDYGRPEEAAVAQRWVDSIDGLRLESLRHEKGTAVLTFDDVQPSPQEPTTGAA